MNMRQTFNERKQASNQEQSPPPGAALERRLKTLPTQAALKDLQDQKLAVSSASTFGLNDSCITIYIDEAWPAEDDSTLRNWAVIGGLVWRGEKADPKVLPLVKNHLKTTTTGIHALKSLLSCERALPFIMPIKSHGLIKYEHYFQLVVSSIKVLLGWLLPQQGSTCSVRILLEQFCQIEAGTKMKDYFAGVLEELRLNNPARCGRWTIDKVQWCGKNEEYIPYADIVCYLPLEHNGFNRELGSRADYRNWPGYLPLSLELVPRLTRLDQFELSKNVEDVLDFVSSVHGTELYRVMISNLAVRFANSVDLQRNLIEAVEKRYEVKDRDLNSLRKQTSAAGQLVQADNENLPMRVRLLWSLIDLQEANHHGDPAKAHAAVEKYRNLRPKPAPMTRS